MTNIRSWLEAIGLGQYADAFESNDVDLDVLAELNDADFANLGLSLGHRRKLLKALRDGIQHSFVEQAPSQSAEEHTPRDSAAPNAAPGAERRQLTVMFCDLVGSTALSERLDPEDLRALMRAYRQPCAKVIERYEGHVAQFLGDGVMAYFGWPVAHEDDAERAVRAGLDIVQAVKAIDSPEPLRVRVGIATGAVVVGASHDGGADLPNAAVGETPNVAARVQGLAKPDQVVIAPTTRQLVAGVFELENLGEHVLKGIVEPLRAWHVTGVAQVDGRFAAHAEHLSPLVGREEETGLLLRRWRLAKAGEGQVVLLCGEPGIGKSRITETICRHVAEEPHIRLRYQCSPYFVNTALYPLIEHLQRAAGFDRNDTAIEQLDKLETLLSQGTGDVAAVAPLFAAMLSIEQDRYPLRAGGPQKQKERTMEALVEQLTGLSGRQPVLMVVEDAHWIDETTLEAISAFIDNIHDRRVLLIVTYRPEFKPPWLGYGHVTVHALNRLTRRQGAALIAGVARAKALPQAVLDQIIERTDGIPLFAEELTKMVLEAGYLEDVGNRYEVRGTMPTLEIPTTLRDSLMARLDQLAPIKEVAQIGACIGRDFAYEVLAAVSPMDEVTLQDALTALVSSGLVFQRGGGSRVSYSFKHALVHEAAMDSLLRNKRRHWHEKVAGALRRIDPHIEENRPELLAHHYQSAGLVEHAAGCWLRAGQLAVRHAANKDAIGHLQKALECLQQTPDDDTRRQKELAVYTVLGPALIVTEGWASKTAKNIYEKAHGICQSLGDIHQQFPALWGSWLFQQTGVGSGHAIGHANELLDIAEQDQAVELRLQANHAAWTTFLWHGDIRRGLSHVETGLPLYDRDSHGGQAARYGGHDPAVCGLGQGALARWLIGTPDRAKADVDQAIALARQLGHPPSVAHGLVWASWVHQFRRDPAAAQACAEEALVIGRDLGLAMYVGIATVVRGWARTISGNERGGPDEVTEGVQLCLKTGTQMSATYFRGLAAEALLHAGRPDDALAEIDKAFALMEETGEGFWKAELLRLSGEAALQVAKPDADSAASRFANALVVAQGQGARALELRAALSLAQLWNQQDQTNQARDLITPIHAAFDEGFDTPDLLAAKAFLASLT